MEFGKNNCNAKRKGENTTFERKREVCAPQAKMKDAKRKETKAKYHIIDYMHARPKTDEMKFEMQRLQVVPAATIQILL